jgi:hypothetical protein
MADLTLSDIFGYDAYTELSYDDNDPNLLYTATVTFNLANFTNYTDEGGDGYIKDGLGISNLQSFAEALESDEKAVKTFYSILLHAMQNQAENINADPEQSVFIAEQSPRLGTGSRSGQVQRSFLVSFFTDSNIPTIADIDDI